MKDTLDEFVEKIRRELQNEITVTPDVPFRELKGFSSIHVLLVYNFLVQEYGVTLDIEEFTRIKTLRELYELVKKHASAQKR